MTEPAGNHRNFPYTSQPTGWFQLGWSPDFPTGVVVPLRYFDQDLVAYRGASGAVHLFDAYCPHLGAHLGYGGKVAGDDITCPFHAWRFDCEGCNVDIPYSARKTTANRLRGWPVREELGVVYFWHDENDIAPRWDPPRPVEDPAGYYPVQPEGTKTWAVRMFPQLVPENAVDFSHFGVTHGATPTPRLLSVDADEFCFRSQLGMLWGGKAEKTWLTPDGPVDGILETEIHGMGVSVARFLGTDGAVSLVGVTPTEGEQATFFMTNWVTRLPGDTGDEWPKMAKRRLAEQFKQAEADHLIWEHQRYVPNPPTAPEDADGYRALRSWARRFYPGEADYEQYVRGVVELALP
jgi:phenylpropionate dioxygenase-like ring-hydroxylating dioxygenase large terminal subunit